MRVYAVEMTRSVEKPHLRTFRLTSGKMLTVDERDLPPGKTIADALRLSGVTLGSERLPVYQGDRIVGTLPRDFDPWVTRPGLFYSMRDGDFVLKEDRWIASRTLCPGDFEYLPEFVRGER